MNCRGNSRWLETPRFGGICHRCQIDGIVAMIMAVGRAMLPSEQPVRSVYEDRGILTL